MSARTGICLLLVSVCRRLSVCCSCQRFALTYVLFVVVYARIAEMHPIKTDNATAKVSKFPQVSNHHTFSKPNLIGDIALDDKQVARFAHAYRHKRQFVADDTFMWELPIHYTIDDSFSYAESLQVKRALSYWQKMTCITFTDIASIRNRRVVNYIRFIKNHGCWSYIGYKSTRQHLSLSNNCLEFGIILHEVGHALGFWHEQSRPDRDLYVTVHPENVDTENHMRNFDKALWGELTTLTIPYDLGSVMHYGPFTFNRTDKATMTTKDALMKFVIGQRESLSFHDVKQANFAYCHSRCENSSLRCENDGYPDPLLNCAVCRCEEAFSGIKCDKPASHSGVRCGGILEASRSARVIQSPGYPHRYNSRQSCSWIIQSEVGSNVYIGVNQSPFGLTCARPGRCTDYVEIRYHGNLSLRGPRYCSCQPPGSVIKSATNKVVVYFQSHHGGLVGFRARFYTESCGGCASRDPRVQSSCTRYRLNSCMRRWRKQKRRKCHGWWFWHPSFCGYEYEEAVREDKCVNRQRFCCRDFTLFGEKCIRAPAKVTTERMKPATTTEGEMWSAWCKWSQCDQPCGACGSRTRHRVCSSDRCGRRKEVERQACNMATCEREMSRPCVKTVSYKALCNPWYRRRRYCTKYKKKNGVCFSRCCRGYVQKGNMCIKNGP